MRRDEIKYQARDAIMHGAQCAITDLPVITQDECEIRKQAVIEFRRVEKLLGYEPGSWSPYV